MAGLTHSIAVMRRGLLNVSRFARQKIKLIWRTAVPTAPSSAEFERIAPLHRHREEQNLQKEGKY